MFSYFLAVRLPSIKKGPSIPSPKIPKHTVFVNVVNALESSSENFHYSNICSMLVYFISVKVVSSEKAILFFEISISGNSVPHQIAKLYTMIKIVR